MTYKLSISFIFTFVIVNKQVTYVLASIRPLLAFNEAAFIIYYYVAFTYDVFVSISQGWNIRFLKRTFSPSVAHHHHSESIHPLYLIGLITPLHLAGGRCRSTNSSLGLVDLALINDAARVASAKIEVGVAAVLVCVHDCEWIEWRENKSRGERTTETT